MERRTMLPVLGLIALIVAAGCLGGQTPTEERGRTVFTVTDAAADMGGVSSVRITVDQVRVHSQSEGWTTVSTTPQTYDLLALKASGNQKLLADTSLDTGSYTKLWLDISNAVVVDNDGEHDARLPSNTLRMQGAFTVEPNATATATFDFAADQSLHVTGDGQYIMAPVVRTETRSNAQASVNAENTVSIESGLLETNVTVGMDAQGNVSVNARIPADADLSVGAQGGVTVGGGSANGSAGAGANVSIQ